LLPEFGDSFESADSEVPRGSGDPIGRTEKVPVRTQEEF